MKFLIAICSLLTAAVAQQPSISCNYFLSGQTYGCELSIDNPNGFNDFAAIEGIHFVGFTNADVRYLLRNTGTTPNVPSIICQSFPNLRRIELYDAGLTTLNETSFSGCSVLEDILLPENRISSIASESFLNIPDIVYIDLQRNLITTLPENVFEHQQNLVTLDLSFNPFEHIPAYTFRPLENLQFLFLGNANLNFINTLWFGTNAHLSYLHLASNRIELVADSFIGLEGLTTLSLAYNVIHDIDEGIFAPLTNLQNLYLNGNNFVELQANIFEDLVNLEILDIGENPLEVIHSGAFNGLSNLHTLYAASGRLRQLNSDAFLGLDNLVQIYLNFNELEDLSTDLFASSPNLIYIGLWSNRLKTLHRRSFGSLTNLELLDLDANIVNALDREIIDDAENLNTLLFSGNLCASNFFGNFIISRLTFLPMLERCFGNMRYIVDITTEGANEFSFFEGTQPGIAIRVNSEGEAHIALTPFDFLWSPSVEIIIGTANNTRSVIRINQETDVAIVPTPNVITRGQWNDFRITYTGQVILVFSGNNTFPLLGYTMEQFFPVNFYGLRAPDARAIWSVQPFDF